MSFTFTLVPPSPFTSTDGGAGDWLADPDETAELVAGSGVPLVGMVPLGWTVEQAANDTIPKPGSTEADRLTN